MGNKPVNNPINTILERIKARRSFSSNSISFQEQSKVPVEEKSTWQTLTSVSVSDLERMGLVLAVELDGDRIINYLKSGNIIGSAQFASSVGSISVIIEPKIPAERLVSIIEFSQKESYFHKDLVETYGGNLDILTLQIKRCLLLIKNSLALGSIRGYKSESSDLPYIKGHADFTQFLCDSWLIGRQSIRCNFSELTVDTPRNRIFRLALVKSSRVLSERGQQELFNTTRMLLYSLNSVMDQQFSSSEIAQIIRDNPRDALALTTCRDIILNLSISPNPGYARSFFSYSINMANLFESYCHQLISVALEAKNIETKGGLVFPIEGLEQTIRLDGLYGEDERRILIECKYKSISSIGDINRSDIYQCVAYCCHTDIQPRLAMMLFPELRLSQSVNFLGSIGGFNITSQQIHVISISLSCTPSEVIESLKETINQLLMK